MNPQTFHQYTKAVSQQLDTRLSSLTGVGPASVWSRGPSGRRVILSQCMGILGAYMGRRIWRQMRSVKVVQATGLGTQGR